jgi:hypothetical protein
MANAIFMFILLVVIGEAFVIWLMNDELKQRKSSEWPTQDFGIVSPAHGEAPRVMTAKDIAAGNLTRQVQRRGKSWADIRNRVESAFEHDPENERAKRIEKFVESYGRTADILNERKNLGEN